MDQSDVIHHGWLVKSPPSKRFTRAKWRRRYFILRRCGPLPSQAVLEYFSDCSRRKLKGRIELEHCDRVRCVSECGGARGDHMFDVGTPKRTFLLVADSRADMLTWVACISQACGLASSLAASSLINNNNNNIICRDMTDGVCEPGCRTTPCCTHADTATVATLALAADSSDSAPVSPASTCSFSGPYIPISECVSGPPPAPSRAPVSLRPFSSCRQRQVARRAALASPSPPASTAPPQVNWDTFPGESGGHSRSRSVPDTAPADTLTAPRVSRPPRPPKPSHLSDTSNYQNCDLLRATPSAYCTCDSDSATPRTPTTVPLDDVTAARLPATQATSRGQIFNYDFSVRPPPAVNRTLKPRKVSEQNVDSVEPESLSIGGAPAPGSAPPAVNRARKPHTHRGAAASHHNCGKVFNLAPPPVRHGGVSVCGGRPQRAAPSPSPVVAGMSANTTINNGTATSSLDQFHEIEYLDLDLGGSSTTTAVPASCSSSSSSSVAAAATPDHSSCSTVAAAAVVDGVRSSSGIVYKKVDFIKTHALNKTRQSVEMERFKNEHAVLSGGRRQLSS